MVGKLLARNEWGIGLGGLAVEADVARLDAALPSGPVRVAIVVGVVVKDGGGSLAGTSLVGADTTRLAGADAIAINPSIV